MVVVHHLNNSRSQRVLWLLEELGLPYEIKHYTRDPRTLLAPPELKAVHPLGKSPVITDGAVTVAESGAILEYLVEKYGNGRLIPAAGTPERLRYRYWMHYAEGTLMTLMIVSLLMSRIRKAPLLVRPIARAIAGMVGKSYLDPNLRSNFAYLEAELGRSEWFAGDQLTAADIQMSFPVEASVARGGLDGKYPRLLAFVGRIQSRPAYKRALERGGPMAYLK